MFWVITLKNPAIQQIFAKNPQIHQWSNISLTSQVIIVKKLNRIRLSKSWHPNLDPWWVGRLPSGPVVNKSGECTRIISLYEKPQSLTWLWMSETEQHMAMSPQVNCFWQSLTSLIKLGDSRKQSKMRRRNISKMCSNTLSPCGKSKTSKGSGRVDKTDNQLIRVT